MFIMSDNVQSLTVFAQHFLLLQTDLHVCIVVDAFGNIFVFYSMSDILVCMFHRDFIKATRPYNGISTGSAG